MMGPRVPGKSNSIPFSLPTDHAEGSARQMVEQHHLSLYKQIQGATAQLDNQEPKSYRLQQQWKAASRKKHGGSTVWNLDNAAMERLLAMEEAGVRFVVDNEDFSILNDVQRALDEKGMDVTTAIRSFQDSDEMGLTQDELGQMIDSFGIKCGAEKLRTLFRQCSSGLDIATVGAIQEAFLKAAKMDPDKIGLVKGGSDRLLKLLAGRETKLKEIFELFDPDGDGSITVDEFYQGLQALHLNPTKAEVDSLMVMFDHDGDGILTYQEFAQFIAGRKKVSRKKQLKDLDGRLNTFAQAGANPRMKRTPRVWSSMLTDEVEKRLIDNLHLVEEGCIEKEKARAVEGQYRNHIRATDLWRVLLEQLQIKISHDHFTHFIQKLPRQQVGGVELVDYQPFLDYFRKTHDKRKKERMAKAKKHAVKRRGAVRKVQTKPPPTRHDSVATAVVEAIASASWGTRLHSEIKKQRARAMTYYLEDPRIQAADVTERPTFKEWLKQPADHRRRTAAQVMSKVDEMIAQQDEEGTHAIMLAFKLADRDEAGNTGVSGCLPPEIFKDTIREICGTRMQGWNDFEGMYNVSPRQLEYCVEIAEKAPVRKPVWQFQDNTGQWRDYDLHDEPNGAAIEEAKRDGKAQFEMKIRGRLYMINLDRMEQVLINRYPDLPDQPRENNGRRREIRCTGEPNPDSGKIRYTTFFARLARCSAQATYEQFKRAGGANRRGSLGDLESETRKLLGGVTYEIQQALAAKVAEMGGEEAMKIAFEKFDTDGDGQISPEELRVGLQELDIQHNGKKISDEEIEKLCVVLDQDQDGCISFDEFVAQFGAAPRQSAREALGSMSSELQTIIRKNKTNLRKIFHAFDEDGDGNISASELRLGLHALNIDVTAAQVKDMINVIDANGDGSIDWNEFQMVFGGDNVVAKGISRSYRRVLESRQRIAAEHPEIMSMRNKAKNAAAKKAIGVGGNDSDSAGERKRLEHLRAKTREMLHGHRVRLVDAFRVFDSNNRGWLDETSFVKMMAYFDPSKKNIAVNDVKSLFRKLDKGKGAELAALRTFFGTDC